MLHVFGMSYILGKLIFHYNIKLLLASVQCTNLATRCVMWERDISYKFSNKLLIWPQVMQLEVVALLFSVVRSNTQNCVLCGFAMPGLFLKVTVNYFVATGLFGEPTSTFGDPKR